MLKIVGALLLLCLCVGFLRLGTLVSFGDDLRVWLCVGPAKLALLPRGKSRKRRQEKEKSEEEAKEKEQKPKKERSAFKLAPDDVLDLLDTAFTALGAAARRACRRVRIAPLELTAVFGGTDPADTARAFGAANTLMHLVMPRAEEAFYIPDPSLHLRVDFDREHTSAKGSFGASLRVRDLLAIALALAIPLGRWFLRFKKAHKRDKAACGAPRGEKPTGDHDTQAQIDLKGK